MYNKNMSEIASITMRLDGLREPLHARINLMHEEAIALVEERYSNADIAKEVAKQVDEQMKREIGSFVADTIRKLIYRKKQDLEALINEHLNPAYDAAVMSLGEVLSGSKESSQ